MRTYVITGAASGIGRALALRLADTDTMLHLHTRQNENGLADVARACRQAGAGVTTYLADLANLPDTADMCKDIGNTSGALDGLVLNAGFVDWRGVDSLTDEDFTYSLASIPEAGFRLCRDLLPLLRRGKMPAIVMVSSFVAHQFRFGRTHMPASATAKAGLEALARSLASELATDGITVNGVVPGYIEKDPSKSAPPPGQSLDERASRVPLQRLGKADEVAGLIAFLLSDSARYITGTMIEVDGGLSLW